MKTNLKSILRCYAAGMSIKDICSAFKISRNTVRKYVRQFQQSGLTVEKLMSLGNHHVMDMFGVSHTRERRPSQRQTELEALLPEYAKRMSKRGMTVKILYEEYHSAYPDGYRHSVFRLRLRQYMMRTRAVGHVEHYAGDQMYIDYAGDKLDIIDEITGESRAVEVFVAILPCSLYTYCEAVRSQNKEDLIKACENALLFFGGVPSAIVPDNLKAAVIRSDRYEPRIQEDFAAFAEHYGCAVCPARVRQPKDKALVENAVKLMYRSVYLAMEGMVFHNLETLNAAMLTALSEFNARQLTGRRQSRSQLFDEVERDYLQPLPVERFVMKERCSLTVHRNSYITLNRHHYSVPVKYIGKRMDVIYNADTIEVYHGFELVTTHHRDDTPYAFTRKDAHNLPGHHGSYEKDMSEVLEHARGIDNIVVEYLQAVRRDKRYLQLAFRACRGILSLEDKYGQARLVSACACAMEKRVYTCSEVKEILEKGEDADFMHVDGDGVMQRCADTPSLPRHGNIRGREYYITGNATPDNINNKNI